MRKFPSVSLSLAAATTILTLGAAGCGDWQALVEEVVSGSGNSSNGKPTTSDAGVPPSPGKPTTSDGGVPPSTGPTCLFEGKAVPVGAVVTTSDGCKACTCDKSGGLTCSANDCGAGGSTNTTPAPACEKVPATGANGQCVAYSDWKTTGTELCRARGSALADVAFTDECEDHQSTREVIFVCCSAAPANDVPVNDVQCQMAKGADGVPCTLCVDAKGVVVKTDCRG